MPWSKESRQSRGYGRAWEIKRERILKRDIFLCRCAECVRLSRVRSASEVDHVVSRAEAKRRGWTSERTEADDNLAAINHDCHVRKGLLERGFKPRPFRVLFDGTIVDE